MHILILKSTLRSLICTSFSDDGDDPLAESSFTTDPSDRAANRFPDGVVSRMKDFLQEVDLQVPDMIGVRVLFGGEPFPRPVLATDTVLRDLESLVPQAPLHLPGSIELVKALRSSFPGTPVALIFETSFFTHLPARERWYGLDPDVMAGGAFWRRGFHGVFHEAVCMEATRRLGSPQPRILSVCLEPRPELAACVGRRPIMVTGGNTPVEGLPGERSCGDLDPSVALKLAHDTHWGPEEASRILTCESGLLGLAGRAVSLADILDRPSDDLQLARDVFLHGVLRACGAGLAALGSLDAIAYSGRYAASGTALHAWLSARLERVTRCDTPHFISTRTLCQHLRDIVRVMAREHAARATL
jgi:acetate kinase